MLSNKKQGSSQNELPHIIDACRRYRTKVYPFSYDRFDGDHKWHIERRALSEYGIKRHDFVIWTDLDEFLTFPAPLRELQAEMHRRSIPTVGGALLDRITADGSLPEIEQRRPLDQQFPLGCHLTAHILRAMTTKIMLAKGWVRVSRGHHRAFNARSNVVPIGRRADYVVHHFKWSQSVTGRITDRLKHASQLHSQYAHECRRLLEHWERFGRIDVDNPRLKAMPAKPIRYFM